MQHLLLSWGSATIDINFCHAAIINRGVQGCAGVCKPTAVLSKSACRLIQRDELASPFQLPDVCFEPVCARLKGVQNV